MPEAHAAYIEILETNRATEDSAGGSLVIPNQVRINGFPLAIPAGETIKVHEITLNDNERGMDVAAVTLTLFARRVTIAAEGDISAETPVDKIRAVRDIQGQDGTWNASGYLRGMYNGLELALSILEGEREPQYRDAPAEEADAETGDL